MRQEPCSYPWIESIRRIGSTRPLATSSERAAFLGSARCGVATVRIGFDRFQRLLTGMSLLGLCLPLLPLFRLGGTTLAASADPFKASVAPVPHSPCLLALREARRYRTRARLMVNGTREALEEWDPQALSVVDPETWRLQAMAADPGGDLGKAAVMARRAAGLARTPEEAAAVAELGTLIDHETGQSAAALQEARRLVHLEPRQPRARMVLRCAEHWLMPRAGAVPSSLRALRTDRSVDASPLSGNSGCRAAELAALPRPTAPTESAPRGLLASSPHAHRVIAGVRKNSAYRTAPPTRTGVRPPAMTRRPRLTAFARCTAGVSPSSPAAPEPLGQARNIAPAGTPGTDARLDQKVWVHVTNEKLDELLAGLTRATGVTLVAHPEVADEPVSVWTEGQPLKALMRDLRHLHGYYWSRARRHGAYAYSLWQDAQSRARDEAEIQRLALERQREFQEDVWKHVKALTASEAELKRWGEDDPYLIAQMLHPVVHAGYQLFAALSPDQQAHLLQGQTPSHGLPAGELLMISPLVSYSFAPPDHPEQKTTVFPLSAENWLAPRAPQGDVVTLSGSEMAPAQRAALEAILQGSAAQEEKEANGHGGAVPYEDSIGALRDAALDTATVSLFRWGEGERQGISLRVLFRSERRPWWLYSNLAVGRQTQRFYDDMLRKGEFRLWPGAQEEVDRFLGGPPPAPRAFLNPTPAAAEPPDPLLDSPVTLDWRLPVRDGKPALVLDELLDALHGQLQCPLILDGGYARLELPRGASPDFRWAKRSLRALLHRLFPDWQVSSREGSLFLRDPRRLQNRLHQVPSAVVQFLHAHKGPFTLDEMALLARSLAPWQAARLYGPLPAAAVDQLLVSQDVLRLYGELAPAQRQALAQGLPFASMTPPQQALFLQVAQRQRPYTEPWRFQHGAVRLTLLPPPAAPPESDLSRRFYPERPVARALFQVRFDEGDTAAFPVDLYSPPDRSGWPPPTSWVGKPFPFPPPTSEASPVRQAFHPAWKPVLADPQLQHRAAVILISRPFADPSVGVQPPAQPEACARALAQRLRGTGVAVLAVLVGGAETVARPGTSPARAVHAQSPRVPLEPLITLREPGDQGGQAFDSAINGAHIDQSPTVFVVDPGKIVRAVFEGRGACDLKTVEAAARRIAPRMPRDRQEGATP